MTNPFMNGIFTPARHTTCGLIVSALLAGSLWLAPLSLHAQAAAPAAAPEPPKGWQSVASLGLTLTRGNSENFLLAVGVNSTRKWEQDEALLGANGGYGENTDKKTGDHTTTEQYAKAYGQWNHLFSTNFYGGMRLDALYDNIADIDYRFTLSPLAGYYFVKNPMTFLSAEAGPSFVFEKQGGIADQYVGLRFAERFEHKFTDKAKLWESADWIPQVSDFNNWILNAEIGVSSSITKTVELRVVLQDSYNNVPAAGREKNDLKLIAAIGYKF